MADRINVGIIGATGMVGQNYIRLLANHPWFKVSYVAASPSSAGKTYSDAVSGRWLMNEELPKDVGALRVYDANSVDSAIGHCSLIFSAVSLDKKAVAELECAYAAKGFGVVSNNSAHRKTADVPMVIPEINPEHLDIIPFQQKNHGWQKGFITVKSNCSIQSYMTPLYALIQKGYSIKSLFITTLQALSGAGYPGVASLDVVDNIVPFIGGEEEKSEMEPLKILGHIDNGKIIDNSSIKISAHCNRVPVIDGHTACVSVKFADKKPSIDEIKQIWCDFSAQPQKLDLPSAPKNAIIVREEANRPQPRKDRDAGKAMAVTVGRLRSCNVFDYRFVGLHHNTVRGAAGGAILIAEMLKSKGYI